MKFTVIWRPSAEAELALIWTESADRSAVTRAANRIDTLLSSNAADAGESRDGGERIIFEKPLAVLVEVSEEDCRANVLHVYHLPTRST